MSEKCSIIGHWAGDAACKFSGKGSGPRSASTPATAGGSTAPAASLREVVYLSNASAGRMEAYPAHLQGSPAKSDKSGKGSEGILSPQIRRTAVARIMRDRQPAGGVR